MKNIRIAPLLSLATIAVAGALAAMIPAFADTTGPAVACVAPTLNPHPSSPIGPTTDTLFCVTPTTNPAGSANGGSAGGTGTVSGSGTHGPGQSGTTAGSGTSNGGTTSLASGSTGSTGSAGSSGVANKSTSTPSTGFFGGLVAFLGAAGGLVFLFGFLILLALILLAVGVAGWLRRRGGAGWNFARVTHRA